MPANGKKSEKGNKQNNLSQENARAVDKAYISDGFFGRFFRRGKGYLSFR
jgi:hypothetical protein